MARAPLLALVATAILGATATPAVAADAIEATEGLQWNWDGAERTYFIQGQIALPTFKWMRALNNAEVRIFGVRIEMVTTCKVDTPLGKSAWELVCTVDDLSIQAVPTPADAGRLTPIAEEWDERLTGKKLEVQFTKDGRVRNVGFVAMDRQNRRDGENIEVMRQLMTRALSPLDLRLPKKGTDKGIGAWAEKSPLVLGFMSESGSVGTSTVEHTITARRDSRVKLQSQGKGTISDASATIVVAGNEEFSDRYDMQIAGDATFDVATGNLVRRTVAASGEPTASSTQSDGGKGLPYVQIYSVSLIGPGEPRPTLPPSMEIKNAFPTPSP